jgi:hypothetical protein
LASLVLTAFLVGCKYLHGHFTLDTNLAETHKGGIEFCDASDCNEYYDLA